VEEEAKEVQQEEPKTDNTSKDYTTNEPVSDNLLVPPTQTPVLETSSLSKKRRKVKKKKIALKEEADTKSPLKLRLSKVFATN